MNDSPSSIQRPQASAVAIFHFGNQADETKRLRFCNYFTLLAEFDLHPHRAAFIQAFSGGGTEAERRREAAHLAECGFISATDVADAVYRAEDADGRWSALEQPEIV